MSRYIDPFDEPFSAVDNVDESPSVEEQWASILSNRQLSAWGHQFLPKLVALYGKVAVVSNLIDEEGDIEIPSYLCVDRPIPHWLEQFLVGDRQQGAGEVGQRWLREKFLRDDLQWLTRLHKRDQAKVARVFLLSGNIADYSYDSAEGYRPVLEHLVDTLQREKDCVLTISLSQGINVYAHDENKKGRIQAKIDSWMKGGIFSFAQNTSLLRQICDLFVELRRWLEGKASAEADRIALDSGVSIIFENAHLLIPQEGSYVERNFLVDSILSWSLSRPLFQTQHNLILVSEYLEDVSQELVSRGGKIDKITVAHPSSPTHRLKFLLALMQRRAPMKATRYHQQLSGTPLQLGEDESFIDGLKRLSNDTAGLNLMGIEDIVQEVNLEGGALASQRLMKAKGERLREESDGMIEVMSATADVELAGYSEIQKRLDEIVLALKQQDRDPLIRDTIPMGILFLGPPGTGKTIAAKVLARRSKINMVKLGDFRGQYVGQSERNLTQILRLIKSLYPVIVFIDEIDQKESRGSGGDSGVSNRVFGKLLEFMSDTSHRGKILWIGASNRPDKIDLAMKRAGRFDLVLPFLLPDQNSRAQIFQYMVEKRLRHGTKVTHTLNATDWVHLAQRTNEYSGAEIEALVNEVLRRIVQQESTSTQVTIDNFKEVLKFYAPPAIRNEYRAWEKLALKEVRFEDLIAEEHRPRWREIQKLAPRGDM